jgi:hypothetical protein
MRNHNAIFKNINDFLIKVTHKIALSTIDKIDLEKSQLIVYILLY